MSELPKVLLPRFMTCDIVWSLNTTWLWKIGEKAIIATKIQSKMIEHENKYVLTLKVVKDFKNFLHK